jgi:hypothetical protein
MLASSIELQRVQISPTRAQPLRAARAGTEVVGVGAGSVCVAHADWPVAGRRHAPRATGVPLFPHPQVLDEASHLTKRAVIGSGTSTCHLTCAFQREP